MHVTNLWTAEISGGSQVILAAAERYNPAGGVTGHIPFQIEYLTTVRCVHYSVISCFARQGSRCVK
jgi:hypothetical protein